MFFGNTGASDPVSATKDRLYRARTTYCLPFLPCRFDAQKARSNDDDSFLPCRFDAQKARSHDDDSFLPCRFDAQKARSHDTFLVALMVKKLVLMMIHEINTDENR